VKYYMQEGQQNSPRMALEVYKQSGKFWEYLYSVPVALSSYKVLVKQSMQAAFNLATSYTYSVAEGNSIRRKLCRSHMTESNEHNHQY
jgi:hypothetical protein